MPDWIDKTNAYFDSFSQKNCLSCGHPLTNGILYHCHKCWKELEHNTRRKQIYDRFFIDIGPKCYGKEEKKPVSTNYLKILFIIVAPWGLSYLFVFEYLKGPKNHSVSYFLFCLLVIIWYTIILVNAYIKFSRKYYRLKDLEKEGKYYPWEHDINI